jgi:hypothetical protein
LEGKQLRCIDVDMGGSSYGGVGGLLSFGGIFLSTL